VWSVQEYIELEDIGNIVIKNGFLITVQLGFEKKTGVHGLEKCGEREGCAFAE